MKKILFITTVLLVGIFNAQSKIDGLGVFKIDKTKISVIDSLSQNGYKLQVCEKVWECSSSWKDFGKTIFETKSNPESPTKLFSNIPDYKLYLVSGYEAAGNKIKQIELHFYKDNLFYINVVEDYGLVGLLSKKYESKIAEEKKEISCSSIYGNTTYEELRTILTLRDDTLFSQINDHEYYDDKCKKQNYLFFEVYNKTLYNQVIPANIAKHKELWDIAQAKKHNLNEL